MWLIGPICVIVGALICLSGFIIAKKPEAKQLFEKIAPFQGFLGVGMLAWGFYDLYYYAIRSAVGDQSVLGVLFSGIKGTPGIAKDMLAAISLLGYILSEIIIGFCLGFGLIANWIPGEGAAEKKGLQIQRKLLAFSLPIGIVGLVFAILWFMKHEPGM